MAGGFRKRTCPLSELADAELAQQMLRLLLIGGRATPGPTSRAGRGRRMNELDS
jgi:hypothetical protein